MIRVSTYPHPLSYPAIPGLEAAGRISVIGQDVGKPKVGDCVVGFNVGGRVRQDICGVEGLGNPAGGGRVA
jgi:NADPH:quinone reductase-like Zn-dependent oxidoreductase